MSFRPLCTGLLLAALLTACSHIPPGSSASDPLLTNDSASQQKTAHYHIDSAFASRSAPAPASLQTAQSSERLGTQWGDDIDSSVTEVNMSRTSAKPLDEILLYYADKHYRGQRIASIALVAGKISLSVIDDRSQPLPLVRDNGRYYLQGQSGQAYRLRYRNHSANTYEIVASVDGLNVISGKAASRTQGGYVLRPHDTLDIAGFRRDSRHVAAFIFSPPGDAYAANTPAGSIRNTGIIGSVVYELHAPRPAVNTPDAFPADSRYAPPPR